MPTSLPVIYLFVGQDEFAINLELAGLEARLGDPATASLNVTRLDGRTFNPDELLAIAGAAPFLARRRLVILENPTARISGETGQTRFLRQLEGIPPSTALALVDIPPQKNSRDKKADLRWLKNWVASHPETALLKEFPLPDRGKMQSWILEQVHRQGGNIEPKAAWRLQELVGVNKRLADQEIQKLLAFVNYGRQISAEDVEKIVADAGQSSIFVLVDAVATGDRSRALGNLRRLLEQEDASRIFGMLVRQFRMLLVARELLDEGGGSQHVREELKIRDFEANKIVTQARKFSVSELEACYHRLLEADERVKSGEMPEELSLDVLVVELTGETPFTPIQK